MFVKRPEVPSPGSHSWWKPGPETTSPVSHCYGNLREEGGLRPWGWSSHITLLYTMSRGNSWTPLVMENSAAPKEADSCVIVIINKNKTLWWTQFCFSDASTKMNDFWILWSDRIFKPSDNTLQIFEESILKQIISHQAKQKNRNGYYQWEGWSKYFSQSIL